MLWALLLSAGEDSGYVEAQKMRREGRMSGEQPSGNPSEHELKAQGLVRPSGYVGTEGEVGCGLVTCSSVPLQLSLLPAHDLLGNPVHSILRGREV